MEEYKKYLETKKFRKKTIHEIILAKKRYLHWVEERNLEIAETEYEDILNYISYLQKKEKSIEYIKKELVRIGHYFKYLKIDNPAYKILLKGEEKRKVLLFNEKELEKIYNEYKAESLEEEIIISLKIYQGIRRPELLKLTKKDIDIKKGKINIPETMHANSREVKLEACQIIPLHKQIEKQDREEKELLFNAAKTKHILEKKLKIWVKKIKEIEPKIKNFNHICRSRYGIWIREEGLRIGQYMSGFKTIGAAENYKEEDITDLKESIKIYHPLK